MKILMPISVLLLGGLIIAIGLVALIDPVRYVRLHIRMADPIGVPYYFRDWYDPNLIANSREMRMQWRMMGFGFACAGSFMIAKITGIL